MLISPYLCTQTQTCKIMAEQKKLSIIAFSGDFDKLTAVFTLGTGAAAVGYEVNIFFTFWGLDAIKQKQGRSFTGGNWLTKIFGFMIDEDFRLHDGWTESDTHKPFQLPRCRP